MKSSTQHASQHGKYFIMVIAFVVYCLTYSSMGFAQLAAWPNSWSGVAASPLNATTIGTNVSVAQLARVGLTGVSSSARYNSSNWSASTYLTITITANTGFVLNMNGQTVSLNMGSSGTGPNGYTLRSSVDGYASSLGALNTACSGAAANTITLPATGFNGLATVTFRITATLTGCSSTFSTGGTGGPALVTINGTAVASSTAPTVTTLATPSAITSTSATLGGSVTATGGANISANGSVYSLTSTNATPAIGGTGVVQLATASPGSGTGSFSNPTVAALAVNTQYSYRAYATNVSGTSYGGATGTTFYTFANVPAAPTVNNASTNSLTVGIAVNGNPAVTQFAIQESVSGNYVQANGSLGGSPVWQTTSTWGSKIVTGLSIGTSYTFRVKARNGAAVPVETLFGGGASKSTLANIPAAATVNGATSSTLNVSINPNGNSSSVDFAIQENISGNYVQANGTLAASPVWQKLSQWGTKTINGLTPSTQYSFRVNARNADNIETGFGASVSKSTLANIPGAPVVDAATSSSLNVTINENNNTATTEYSIYESTTGNYVQANGSFAGTPFWQTASQWGVKTVIDLASSTLYTFQVNARNADLVETGLGAGTDGLTLDAGTPFLSVTPLTGFGEACIQTTTVPLSFTLTGQNLTTSDIIINALPGFAFADNNAGPFTSTLTITQPGGDFSQEIFVVFNPTLVQAYNGNIVVSGAGAIDVTVSVTASGINTAPSVISTSISNIGNAGVTLSADITSNGCTSVTSYGIEYSLVNGFANGTGIQVFGTNLSSNSFTVAVNGLQPSTTYYYKSFATNDGGTTYSTQSTFETLTPILSATALNDFGSICLNVTQGPNTFTITGENLTAEAIHIASVAGYTFSIDDNLYSASLDIPQTGGAFSQLIYVKFTPVNEQTYNANINITGGDASGINVSATGAGINTPATVITGLASSITQITATLAGSVSAVGCSNITAYGIEYSTVNGFVNGTGTQVAGNNISSNIFSVDVSGLGANTNYYYKGYVTNAAGTTYGTQQSFTTTALDAPIATVATNITGTQFDANWNVVTGATGYRLDVSTSPTFTGGTNATDLFISEYVEGTSFNKYIEIFNGTGNTVDLSNYKIRLYSNGGTTATNDVQLSGNLANGSTIVLKHASASAYAGAAAINGAVNYNGDDAVELFKISLNAPVDIIGKIGEDPGTAWTSGALSTLDKTLVRKASVTGGVTTNPASGFPTLATQWDVFNIDDVSHLGSHSFNGSGPSFIPGYNNLLVNGTTQSVSGLSSNTTYYYRVRATSVNSTSANSNVISVLTCSLTPTISGNNSFCEGSSVVLTSSIGTSYQWNLNNIPISGETSQTITVSEAGNYSVTLTNENGCTGTSAITAVSVNSLPATPVASITQPDCATATGTINVTAPNGPGITYSLDGQNFQPSGIFAGKLPGDYTVTVKNSGGCISSTVVTIQPQPVIPSAPIINGVVNVCAFIGSGEQLTYTASAAGATSYTWSLPQNVTLVSGQGTGAIVVSFNAGYAAQANKQIRVTASSVCGTSPLTVFYTLAQFPTTPLPVTGEINVCSILGTASELTYTIPKVTGATSYLWSAQAGTTTITHPNGTGVNDTIIRISFAAGFTTSPVTVQSVNDCGTSAARSLTILRNPPAVPGLINGPTNVCAHIAPGGMAATYTIIPVAGAVSYTWTIPAAATNITGQGTNTISFIYPTGFVSGNISVTATNGCGTSAPRQLAVSRLLPATPSVIDVIQISSCPERVYSYTLAGMPSNATSINWTIPASATITAGQGTKTITVSYPATAVAGTITAQAISNCGASVIRESIVKLPVCPVDQPRSFSINKEKASYGNQTTGLNSDELEVTVMPNPATDHFTCIVKSNNAVENVALEIFDLNGKKVEIMQRIKPGTTIVIGKQLLPGMYVASFRQGNKNKVVKLVKY